MDDGKEGAGFGLRRMLYERNIRIHQQDIHLLEEMPFVNHASAFYLVVKPGHICSLISGIKLHRQTDAERATERRVDTLESRQRMSLGLDVTMHEMYRRRRGRSPGLTAQMSWRFATVVISCEVRPKLRLHDTS